MGGGGGGGFIPGLQIGEHKRGTLSLVYRQETTKGEFIPGL